MNLRESNVQTTESSAARRLMELGRNKVAAGVLIAVGMAALAGCAPSEAATPREPATQSAGANPTETTTPVPVETTPAPEVEKVSAESLRLAADLPPQQLAEGVINLRTEWMLADANAEEMQATVDGWYSHTEGGLDEYVANLTQENADYYTAALLPDDWETNNQIAYLREYAIGVNGEFIRSVLKRSVENEPILDITNTITEAAEGSAVDGQRIINFKLHQDIANANDDPTNDEQVQYRFDVTDGTARLVGYVVTELE